MPERSGRRGAVITKHSLVVAGHRTSITLEDAFWAALKVIARRRAVSVASLVAEIDGSRDGQNLSSALRVFVLEETMGLASAGRPPQGREHRQAAALAEGEKPDPDENEWHDPSPIGADRHPQPRVAAEPPGKP